MFNVNNVPIIGKFLIVLTMFGALVLGSVVFSASKMRHIDDMYSDVINQQGKAAVFFARANQAISQAKGAVADLVISTTDDDNARYLAKLKANKEAFVDLMGKAKAALPAMKATIDQAIPRGLAIFTDSCAKSVKLGADSTVAAATAQAEYLQNCDPAFAALEADLLRLSDQVVSEEDKVSDELTGITDSTITITYSSVLGGMALVFVIAFIAMRTWVSNPLRRLTRTMADLALGNYSIDVLGTGRKDEIGPMAQAVQVFKDNGLKLGLGEAAAERQRLASDQERAAAETVRAEVQRQQQAVVACVAAGLERLSKGDLTSRLSQAFAEEYENLRADFNATADSLREAMSSIMTATDGISSGSDQIAHASDDLSRRTEQQAASLEETAAALNHITETVKLMAANANEAAKVVVTTRSAAETSGAIVQQAVDAMGKIKDSSNQISNIIGVIDEIAFQTNLLALNAGVEAARAGDAGRGFAVVASEVRGLAQRSAEAAKEIKALIQASSGQVETGVVLVDKTGAALKDIVTKVMAMDTLVRQISASSQEQATGLAEINTAIGQMDQVVQQNAAMVEESTAAAHALKGETQGLTTMVGRFNLGDKNPAARGNPVHRAQAKLARDLKTPTRHAPRAMLKTTDPVHQSAATDKDWEEF